MGASKSTLAITSHCLALAAAQQPGTVKPEEHLSLSLGQCSEEGCAKTPASVALDANWRWTRKIPGYSNCYTGAAWDAQACDTPEDCAKNCALEGNDRAAQQTSYGITSDGDTLTLGYVTGSNVGSRLYMLEDESHYKIFKLLNSEFTFDVDVSKLPCGVNGALYFVEMPADGGASFSGNQAGAKFGTGYCDAQCPRDVKWINGEANIVDWNTTSATGGYGSCCAEMDIWEANKQATAYTAHPCALDGPKRCETEETCAQTCDKAGCDLNTYRLGDKTFFGEGAGFTVDTSKPFSVVTQFITDDGTDSGELKEIRRKWVQDGKVMEMPKVTASSKEYDSITAGFCRDEKAEFKDGQDQFDQLGGLPQMGKAMQRGMVLVMSIWDDGASRMLWLDSIYPTGSSAPGALRGPCDPSSGEPSATRAAHPESPVKYGNIRVGPIGSTLKPPAPGPPTPAPTPTPAPPSGAGSCCYVTCGNSCHTGAADYCAQSEDHCVHNCNGLWCPKLETVL